MSQAISPGRQLRRGEFLSIALLVLLATPVAAEPRQASGIYPHLAMFNNEGECGTGGVVPWAGRLWAVTYAPHMPEGSSDKLYEITPDLRQIVRPESIGGTPANRFLHRESNQLFIGPYAISATGTVRTIPYAQMYGRPTGTARHLFDPAGKVYYATMEEGIYEVDVKTLEVTELWADEQRPAGRRANLPGYHGKGLYTGQGLLIYANNGDHAAEARLRPDVPSGALAEWDGRAAEWHVARRNQFTEVTGPGGLEGNTDDKAPVWSIGWDHRSLLLLVRDEGLWHTYRLPKGSHSYDGAHGWNTEWPRIRDIGEADWLMTMHGTFWRFPPGLRAANSAGIVPRSNYLKVVGDFCRWGDRLVLGCDDSAKNEFLNKRPAKGGIAGPGQSQSNLWFIDPAALDGLGPALGRGAVWLNDSVTAGVPSDAYLFGGYALRGLHLAHGASEPVTFTLEVDRAGNGEWKTWREVEVPAEGNTWLEFPAEEQGAWLRVKANRDLPRATAWFQYRAADHRPPHSDSLFSGLARVGETQVNGGEIHARGGNARTLRFVARNSQGELGGYDLDADLNLKKINDPEGVAWTRQAVAIPKQVITVDEASVLLVEGPRRWRFPKGSAARNGQGPLGEARVCREVCTERDLFHAHGTIYELPAENAGGFAKIRPLASHEFAIHDYASFRGLLVLTGLQNDAQPGEHVVRSDDGLCGLWVGAVDDLWKLGKPRGRGGPWHNTAVKANQPSDPYLMTGYDVKRVELSHAAPEEIALRLEVDLSGTGQWVPYRTFQIPAGQTVTHEFPRAYSAYWIRAVATREVTATVTFTYE